MEDLEIKSNMSVLEAMLDSNCNFGDTNLVAFVKKHLKRQLNEWIFGTRHMGKAVLYRNILKLSDVNSFRWCGENILHHCILYGGSPESIQYLIEKGADVNFVEPNGGTTPLFRACRYGNYQTVKMLLNAGADPRCRCFEGKSALQIAFNYSAEETFFLVYDVLFQQKLNCGELVSYLATLNDMTKNIIQQSGGDRSVVRDLIRLNKWLEKRDHMVPIQLGYILDSISCYEQEFLDERLLHIGNERNDFQIICVVLRRQYRQRKTRTILFGFKDALDQKCGLNILNLYASYLFRRLGDFIELCK